MSLNIHPLTNDPTSAWKQISKSQKVIRIQVKTPKTPVAKDKLRFVCMSDTHSLTPHIKFEIPDGDVFIHAGDFTKCGGPDEVAEFNTWLGRLPHKYKIVIAGNHELSFDPTFTRQESKNKHTSAIETIPDLGNPRDKMTEACKSNNTRQLLTNCTYLEDNGMKICGISIYGTPWQPEFCKWAFNVPRGKPCLEKWLHIPRGTDVLITHTPPLGHGDLCCSGIRAGCVELLTEVQTRVQPRYHVFGHIHEGYGVTSDGQVIYINASTCDINYLPNNPPIVFDVPIPTGFSKS